MTRADVPAVPLVTHHPYFSVWSPADELHAAETVHWTGATHGLLGMVEVDGERYRFAGRDGAADEPLPAMSQTGCEVRPTTTAYTFEAAGVELVVEFTSPLLLEDLDVLSRPATYVAFTARAVDGAAHDVRAYLDVTAEWCVDTPDQTVEWGAKAVPAPDGERTALRAGTTEQDVLGHVGDDVRIDWGHCYLVPPSAADAAAAAGADVRERFRATGRLPDAEEGGPRAVGEAPPALATAFDLDARPGVERTATVVLAYDERKAVEYFEEPLDPYWRRDGTGATEMLATALEEERAVRERCADFDAALFWECLDRGGEAYADLAALAYRQAVAAHALAEHEGDLLFFSKECFSNGCIATVDVTYPSAPLFYRFEPELVKGMLRPVLRYARTDDWPYEFAPHDVGTYPKANGQVYGREDGALGLDDQMPVEECGNALITTAAICLRESDPSFADEHWDLLTEWAAYLRENGYDPGEQLCTDDFAGHLAHNVNLSVKAIVGIASYGLLCELRGDAATAAEHLDVARGMAAQWRRDADDGDHYRLAFDQPGTWSLKYNLVWDRLFDLDAFGDQVRRREVETYRERANEYGTPLDSRESYTKTDWLVWAATLADDRETVRELIAPIRRFLAEAPDRVPFTDWYDTESGEQIGFQHRSVIGGVFLPLLEPADFRDRG